MKRKIKAWKRVVCSFVALLLVAQFCTSCAGIENVSVTCKLWDDADPHSRIWIPADKITEQELQKRGVKYEKFTNGQLNGYVVHKSSLEKFGDYTVLTLGTPITVAIDAAGAAVAVGAVAVAVVVGGRANGGGIGYGISGGEK